MLGFGDAARALAPEADEPPATVEELRALLATNAPKQLAAAKADEQEQEAAKGKRGKG